MNSGRSLINLRPKRKSKKLFPQRGHVYLIDFEPARGHEIKKKRPAVIVSNNEMNELSDTVLAMPITSGKYIYHLRVTIKPPEGGLEKPSSIVTDQVRTLDKSRIGRHLGKIDFVTMLDVEQSIRDHFGLPEGNILP